MQGDLCNNIGLVLVYLLSGVMSLYHPSLSFYLCVSPVSFMKVMTDNILRMHVHIYSHFLSNLISPSFWGLLLKITQLIQLVSSMYYILSFHNEMAVYKCFIMTVCIPNCLHVSIIGVIGSITSPSFNAPHLPVSECIA